MSIQEIDYSIREEELRPVGEMFAESIYHRPYDVPVDSINTAHQMRPKEDIGDIKELVRSVKELGVEQPIRLARWTKDEAQEFIEVNNRAYPDREPMSPEDLVPCPDGVSYLVVIYGHRRLIAGVAAGLEVIPAKITESPSFHEVVQIQTAENLHQRPKPFAFARSLKQVYELGMEVGAFDSKAQFARKSGVSVEATTSALRYCSLPFEYQKLVIDGELPYSKSVQLARLMEAVIDYELLQLQIKREADVDGLIKSGEVDVNDRENYIKQIEVDDELSAYLSERVKGVLGGAALAVADRKMSIKNCTKYVTGRINAEFKGVGSLFSSMNDEDSRRRYAVDIHKREASSRREKAFTDLRSLVVALQVDASAPEEISAQVHGTAVQRLLHRTSAAAGAIARGTIVTDTAFAAFDAKASVDELVDSEAALLEEVAVGDDFDAALAEEKHRTSITYAATVKGAHKEYEEAQETKAKAG